MQDKIREMAELVENAEKVWFHRTSQAILSHPDPDHPHYSTEHDYLVEDILEQVNADYDNYIQIPALSAHESYQIMEGYADTVTNERTRFRLFDALASKKPFRYFRNAVESDDLLDDWYTYHNARLQDYVMSRLEKSIL